MLVNVPKESPQLTDDDKAIILEELNIKAIKSIGPNVLDKVYVFSATPVFDKLGPKFGKQVNKVADWIKSMSHNEIEKLLKFGSLKKELDGEIFEISKQDTEIRKVETQGVCVAIEGDYGVSINTTLSKELENEGLVRELIHKIQLMRKQADFNLVDRIKIFYQTDEKLKDAILHNLEYLKNETLAIEVTEGAAQGEVNKALDINGIKTKISLQRVNPTE